MSLLRYSENVFWECLAGFGNLTSTNLWFKARRGSNHTAQADVGYHRRDQLHWLPVRRQVRVCVCTGLQNCACLHQASAANVADMCTYRLQLCICQSKSVISVLQRVVTLLAVPLSRTARCGQRGFAVSSPTRWNSLPPTVRGPSLTLTQCCALLKTMLFCGAYEALP